MVLHVLPRFHQETQWTILGVEQFLVCHLMRCKLIWSPCSAWDLLQFFLLKPRVNKFNFCRVFLSILENYINYRANLIVDTLRDARNALVWMKGKKACQKCDILLTFGVWLNSRRVFLWCFCNNRLFWGISLFSPRISSVYHLNHLYSLHDLHGVNALT